MFNLFLHNCQKLYTKLSGIAVFYSHSSVQMHPRLAENRIAGSNPVGCIVHHVQAFTLYILKMLFILKHRYRYAGGDQVFDLCSNRSTTTTLKASWDEMPPVLQPEVTTPASVSDDASEDPSAAPLPTWSYRRGTTVTMSDHGKARGGQFSQISKRF